MKFHSFTPIGLAACVLALSGTAAASQAVASLPDTRPQTLDRLLNCRQLTSDAARLACYDTAVGAFETAQQRGEVVVVDRAQVNEARRQLFGFALPRVTLFDQDGRDAPVEAIETSLVRATQTGEGRWVFTLADESVWRQIDSERVNFRNRPGQDVRIRRAALGSYLMTIEDSRAVRVRRQ